MNENDLFSGMNKKEKKDLLKFLKEYYIEYKPYLKLGNLSFGLEMEFLGSDDMDDYSNYTPFSLACEDSVDRVNGYELQSPILYDNEFSWIILKNTCDYLKLFGSCNERCGGHIHFGADVFKDNCDYLKNLVYLWMAYEDIIYRFGNGEMLNTRFSANTWARPASWTFRHFIDDDEYFKSTDYFLGTFKNITRNLGINFNNYYAFRANESLDKNTIEIRCPNGTLEEVIWQNNVNFFGSLIKSSVRDDLNLLDLYFLISERDYYNDLILEYGHINLDKALSLADLIYDNNRDKLDFLKQYIKNGKYAKGHSLVKSKKFWK